MTQKSKRLVWGLEKNAEQVWKEQNLLNELEWMQVKRSFLEELIPTHFLGTTSYGVNVALVTHLETNMLYVLRYVKRSALEYEISSLSNERNVLLEVNSDWVLRMHLSFMDSKNFYLLVDYFSRGSLLNLLHDEGRLKEDYCIFYGAEMLMGINQLHRNGFMHRNIGPGSFMIDHRGHLKICDFGYAFRFLPKEICQKMARESSFDYNGRPQMSDARRDRIQLYQRKSSHSVGNLSYMAPEVIRSSYSVVGRLFTFNNQGSEYTFACDFWSFGVTMYQCFIGMLPFDGKDDQETKSNILKWRKIFSFPGVYPISEKAEHLIRRLVVDEPLRLGIYGCEDIMAHPFFSNVDWLHLRKKEILTSDDWPRRVITNEFDPNESLEYNPEIMFPAIRKGRRSLGHLGSNPNDQDRNILPYLTLAMLQKMYRTRARLDSESTSHRTISTMTSFTAENDDMDEDDYSKPDSKISQIYSQAKESLGAPETAPFDETTIPPDDMSDDLSSGEENFCPDDEVDDEESDSVIDPIADPMADPVVDESTYSTEILNEEERSRGQIIQRTTTVQNPIVVETTPVQNPIVVEEVVIEMEEKPQARLQKHKFECMQYCWQGLKICYTRKFVTGGTQDKSEKC